MDIYLTNVTWRNDVLIFVLDTSKQARKPSQALWRQGWKRKENLQLHLWNLNSTSNPPLAWIPVIRFPPISAKRKNERECKQKLKNMRQEKLCYYQYHLSQSAFRIDFFDADIQIPILQLQALLPFPAPECPGELARRLEVKLNLLPAQYQGST